MTEVRYLLFTAETDAHLAHASADEIRQLLANKHITADNPQAIGPGVAVRRLLIGRTEGGRYLTVVIEATLDPTTWLPITAWDSTAAERKLLEHIG